ncbi:MAG TPA: AAA family ATPase [Bacteroidia bacterium]|jgi:exonuclease SbcC
MNKYKINRIYLENFKLIKNSLSINDLAEKNFIVFDGPNGFGKTTIFDAIEIALTGEVFRIFGTNIVPGNQGADDCVFLNDQTRPLKIVIEFITDSSQKKILFVYGKNGSGLSKPDKKANNRSYFKRYELSDFDDYNKATLPSVELTQADINSWFEGVELDRYYKLYHYIQQAETTFFFKQKEDDRMKQLGVLFDTKKEEEDKAKIKVYFDKVVSEYNTLSNSQKDKNALLLQLEPPPTGDVASETVYRQIFSGFEYAPEWDNEKLLNIRKKDLQGISTRDIYKIEVNKLSEFLTHFESNHGDFQNHNFNKEIDNRIEKTQILKDVVKASAFIEHLKSIKDTYETQNIRVKIAADLQKENIQSKIDKIDFKSILKDLNQELELEVFEEKIEAIQKLAEKETELSEIIRDFENTRTRLIELFNNIIKKEPKINDKECPLCGYEREEGYKILIQEVENKKERIKLLQDDNALELTKLYDDFYNVSITPLVVLNNAYLDNPVNRIKKVFYDQVNIDESRQKNVTGFMEWVNSINIDISQHIFNLNNEEVVDLDDRVEKITEALSQAKKSINESFNFDLFNSVFEEIFEKDAEKVKLITQEAISTKIKYIDQEYFKGNQEEKERLTNEINFINNEQLPKLDESRKKLNFILDIYDAKIHDHRIEIAKNIEIPFFIYSSKILQNFEKGVGVFIQFKQSSRTENLKFTQGMDTSHDVLYSMSSGQLAALVIAFTLAMNKIYDKSTIGMLLIDDPVQSMDEINMASLVDLIRNDFAHKQIILSTHEEDISAFMRFKFHNFNRKTHSVNMKKEQFDLFLN